MSQGLNFNNTELLTAGLESQFPKGNIPEVAFSGRSNVGKSSLINCLLGRKAFARVSSTPGKTVTVNFYTVDRKIRIVDLPGYGYARTKDSNRVRFSGLTDAYIRNSRNLAGVVQLIDMKVGPTADDIMMLDWMIKNSVDHIVVATKSDKLNKTEFDQMLSALRTHPYIGSDIPVIPFSVSKFPARDEVWNEIFRMCRVNR